MLYCDALWRQYKLGFNQYQKFIYGDLESLIEKTDGCKNIPEKSSSTKIDDYIMTDFSMSTILSFKSINNKPDVYRRKGQIRKPCESVGDATETIR